MNYRITTNGEEFRIEAECQYKGGFLFLKTITIWEPVDKFGEFIMEYEDGDWDDEDVEYYETHADAQLAMNKFNEPPQKIINRWDTPWTPV
jgi:hypothetical protein